MTSPVYRKQRVLVNAVSVTATINLPAFPDGSADPLVFAGALGGAKVGGYSIEVASWSGLTSIDAKIQHSDNGSDWEDVDATNLAFTQATGNTTEDLDVPDDTFMQRFQRVAFTVVGTGSAAVTVKAAYLQCGPRDQLAPPGLTNKVS